MKSIVRILTVAILVVSFSTVRAAAQGPAGSGASMAAGGGSSSSSSRSLNPLKLFGKKEAKPDAAANAPVANDDLDRRPEAQPPAMQGLGANATLKDSCR